ncbi:MAG: hypothetical protein ABI599_18695 [Flavobacteriales bacterium]
MPTYGAYSGKAVLMTGAGEGFVQRNVYYSQSSGSGYSFYHTNDDWNEETPQSVGGGGGGGADCCWAWMHGTTPGGALIYQWIMGPGSGIYILAVEDGVVSSHFTGLQLNASLRVAAVNDSVLYVASTQGDGSVKIFKSENGVDILLDTITGVGTAWSIDFVSDELGCMLTKDASGISKLWLTEDGGYTWTLTFSIEHRLRQVRWGDDQVLWAVGDSGLIVHSEDRGQEWTELPPPVVEDLHCLDRYTADSLWVGGEDGLVLVSGNAGLTWTELSVPDTTIVRLQTFPNAVYAYSANGNLYKFRPPSQDLSNAGTGSWWIYADTGVRLRLEEDETVTELYMCDTRGRSIGLPVVGSEVDLRSVPAGLYVLTFVSNKRAEKGKVLWLSPSE